MPEAVGKMANAEQPKKVVLAPTTSHVADTTNQTTEELPKIPLPLETIHKVFEQFDDEWITAAALGSTWKRLQVDFDPRTYGCKKLTDLVKKYSEIFACQMRKSVEGTHGNMYVKLKI